MSPARTAALAFALGAAAPHLAHAAPPPCGVELRLTPEQAVVGEQVVYAARIARRADVHQVYWATAPGFPGFRVEWLPSRTFRESPGNATELVVEERRALFPVRAGKLALPPAVLGCSVETADGSAREFRAETAPTTLDVATAPEAGRPAEWNGLVGSLRAEAGASATSLHLGESVRIWVRLLGEANLWDAAPPFGALGAQAELLPRPDVLELDPGARLHARRSFAFDLVPHRTGTLVLPEVRIAYWNPTLAAYRSARASLPAIEVAPRRSAPPTAAARPPRPRASTGPWIGLFAVVLCAGVAGLALLHRRRRTRDAGADEATLALARAEARRTGPEAARLLELALRVELARKLAGARSLSVEEMRATAAADAEPALADLERLERARFDPEAPAPDLNALRERLRERLQAGRRAASRRRAKL